MKSRRTTRLPPQSRLLCVLALVLLLGPAGGAAASPGAAESLFFRLSPIQAVTLAHQSATRYSVTVSDAPVGNEPYARWYLDLPAGAADCTDAVLAGGTRVSRTEFAWKNQGTTFAWYHGARGTYRADRSYGCDQARIGRHGYPGRVTVVFENDSQHCTATFTGVAAGPEPRSGPQPVCELGGYVPLPVPKELLDTYSNVDRELTELIARAQAAKATGAALDRAIVSILQPQTAAFERLFPPVWGCDFGSVFSPLLTANEVLDAQDAALTAGKKIPGSSVAADVVALTALGKSLRACMPTPTRPLGVPHSVVGAVDRLAAEAAVLHRAAIAPALLRTRLRALDSTLNTIVARSFPVVFDMPYVNLLDRVLAESSAIRGARQDAQIGNTGAAVSALRQVAGDERGIGTALHKEANRAAKAEKAA